MDLRRDILKKDLPQIGPPLGQLAAVVATGLGIGWLAGLSLSPVAHIVVTSVLGLAAAAVAVFASVDLPAKEKEEKTEPNGANASGAKLPRGPVNAAPIALLVLSISAGAPLGVYVRTHEFLGVQESHSADDKKKSNDKDEGKEKPADRRGGLFVGEGVNLSATQAHDQPGLILAELKGAKNPSVQKFAASLNNRLQQRELTATDVLQVVCKELLTNE